MAIKSVVEREYKQLGDGSWVYRYPGKPWHTATVEENGNNPPLTTPLKNNTNNNIPFDKRILASNRDKSVTSSFQVQGKDYGFYAKRFDEVVSEAGGRCDKREVAVTIGLQVTSDAFRQILHRRKRDGFIRAYRGSHYLIEWINRDYSVTQLDKVKAVSMLDIALPLSIHEYANLPPRSMVGVAGETSSGKTSFLLEMAELNVLTQPKRVYYFYMEMSEAKMMLRCEDFPLLVKAWKDGKFYPVMQTDFEFPDVIQPDAINLIDYLDRDDDAFMIGQDIKNLYKPLNSGIVVYALQKPHGRDTGFGGNMSIKLSNLYIALDKKYETEEATHGKAKIVKCKDWKQENINPTDRQCEYHTGGKHGKLFIDSIWKRIK